MKRKLFSFGCCLVMLLAAIFTSCKQEVPVPEMVTISYVSEYGTLAKTEKIVEKGYKLKADDLPTLKEEGYTFDNWYINKEEAKVGTVINKDTVLVAKWNQVVDTTAPKDVTELKAENLNGTIALTWIDPSDEDLFGIEISYKEKVETVARAIAPIESKSIMVAPGDKHAEVSKLTSGTIYIFTVKAVDLAGNKSSGETVECKPEIKTGTPMEITLTPTNTNPTNQPFDVNVEINTAASLDTVKFAKDIQQVHYFGTAGDACTKDPSSENKYTFNVAESGNYTVFAQDVEGRREVKTIKITNIDLVKPNPITDFEAEYHANDKKIVLTWVNPTDEDFKEVKIVEEDNTYTLSNKEVRHEISVTPLPTGKLYTFKAYAYDNAENVSKEATCNISVSSGGESVITGFIIPKALKAMEGKTIYAEVKGNNLNIDGVTSEKFILTCSACPSIVEGATVEIIDADNVKIGLKVPEKAGNYTVNVAIKDTSINKNGTFTVEESALIGDILLNDGKYVSVANLQEEQKAKAVAVVCGVNSEGKLLGLGLKQSETTLAWAKDGSTGYSTKFTDIICTPDKTGSGAADSATFTGDTDGSDNWSVICGKDTAGTATEVVATNYPAFNWVKTYGEKNVSSENYKTGWYMPSIAELTEIYRNRTEVNAALNKLGPDIASPLKDTYYWSSSQGDSPNHYAWQLNFSSGSLYSSYKKYDGNVCCVRAF